MLKMASVSPTKSGSSGKKVAMASALVSEKMAHLRADIRLGLYKLSHPSLPKEDHAAAQESNIVQKSVATGTVARSFLLRCMSLLSYEKVNL